MGVFYVTMYFIIAYKVMNEDLTFYQFAFKCAVFLLAE